MKTLKIGVFIVLVVAVWGMALAPSVAGFGLSLARSGLRGMLTVDRRS